MEIKLPPDINGNSLRLPPGTGNLTIIGANGAGKTRFSNFLADSLGDKAFRLSALRGIFINGEPIDHPGTIDRLFLKASKSPSFLTNDATTPFERLIALMLNEEIAELVAFKMHRLEVESGDRKEAQVPVTKLDEMIARWEMVFPRNQILRQGGNLLFSREVTGRPIFTSETFGRRKSRTVLFRRCALRPRGSRCFRRFPRDVSASLAPSENMGHDGDHAPRLPVCLHHPRPRIHSYEADQRPAVGQGLRCRKRTLGTTCTPPRGEGISDEIYMAIAGARKPMLFIEGDASHSIDAKLYPLVFRDFTVKSLGSCDKVIESTRTFNDQKSLHHLDARGIVDRDRARRRRSGISQG